MFRIFNSLVVAFVWFVVAGECWADDADADYKNSSLPIEQRVQDLLGRMTVQEKVGQLLSYLDAKGEHFNENCASDTNVQAIVKRGLGSLQPITVDIQRDAKVKNAIQKYVIENTRLGIPVYFVAEALHGLWMLHATSFPQAIAQASSWDTDLVRRIAATAAQEARVRGHQLVLTPVVDLAREPRWGRTEETFGEDTYLSSLLGIASVTGFQGGTNGVIAPLHVSATLKHFAGHGQPESGINRGPVEMGERTLRQFHLEVFRQIINHAHPAALMPSYNSVDGLPSHANPWLLREVLRNEWGFDGLVVSDWSGIKLLHLKHFVAADSTEAAEKALRAGVDVDQPNGDDYVHLPELVAKNPELEQLLDAAVARVLRFKFEMGLFEYPYINDADIAKYCNTPEAKQLAYEAATKSMVLLQNRNGTLPLDPNRYKSVAVIGAHADDMVLGGYSGVPPYKTTLFSGISRKLKGKATVRYAKGFEIFTNYPKDSNEAWNIGAGIFPTAEQTKRLFDEALATARQSDLVILCLGEDEMITHEACVPIRPGDHDSLDLRSDQLALFKAVKALGKPVVVYLMNGRPLSINELDAEADAVLEGWYAGQEGGNAAADILFGDVNPSGKLPVTFPKSVGQLPLYYNYKPSGRRYDYVEQDTKPLYPFGYGLSYTTFEYTNLQLSAATLTAKTSLTATLTVKNTGQTAGTEIVQLYLRDKVSSIERPVLELKDFARVDLKAGESKQIQFVIDNSKLEFWTINNRFESEPGEFELMIGVSSADIRQRATFRLIRF